MLIRENPYAEGHPIKESITEFKDKNSCTVVALSCVTGQSFKDCNAFLHKHGGRSYRRGMRSKDIHKAFTKFTKYKVVKSPYTTQNRITINQFIKKHPKGKFYCCSRGHAFAIVDGVLHDHCDKPRRQITLSYRFYDSDDLEELYNERK